MLLPSLDGNLNKKNDIAVPTLAKRHRKIIRLSITAVFLVSTMLSYYIWQSSKMFEIKLRINVVEKNIKALENSNADLKIEISKLQALRRIEQIAVNDLGMVSPKNAHERFIVIPSDWNKKK